MIKTILVPVSGATADETVIETAYAIAQPLGAHLDFYHLRIGPAEASCNIPHVAFAQGKGLRNAFDHLKHMADDHAARAERLVRKFCNHRKIGIVDRPTASGLVSASWTEEKSDGSDRLLRRARHSDLVVLERTRHATGLPSDIQERVLLNCGRPLVIAAAKRPERVGTVMVAWKESAEAARALTAALPLLERAEQVVLVTVEEEISELTDDLADLRRSLSWHGIDSQIRLVAPPRGSVAEALAATAEDIRADLLVMGGYGHGRMREICFGGCTQAFLTDASLPVFMLH